MNNAQKIIQKFGGQTALAHLLGKRQSMVQHWAKVGIIPAKWHSELLKLGVAKGINLQPIDFIDIPGREASTDLDHQTKIPKAEWFGFLSIGDTDLPCYVLDDGRRVISRTGATDVLTGKRGGGNLESYLGVQALKEYIPSDLPGQMIEFELSEVVNKNVFGMRAETFLEICKAYIKALDDRALETERQKSIAIKASMFMASCAKVGLIALIDEATGYQYERPQDALQLKLKLYLEEAIRKWEKTFPEEVWVEFGRLTNWKGSVTKRPKYWGKLVMELVYEYLDQDVAKWLKENAPSPRHGQNYHQWLSGQYGLKKLIEHIWMVIGIARTCRDIWELKEKMAEMYGRVPVQYILYLPMPSKRPED